MRALRILLITTLLLSVSVAAVFGFDFGFIIENATTGGIENLSPGAWDPQFSFDQRDSVSLWLDFGRGEGLGFAVQGSYTYSRDIPLLLDVTFLLAMHEMSLASATLSLEAGRLFLSDFTGYVLSHRADGAAMALTLPWMELSAGAGYTGLLLKPTAAIAISRGDINDLIDDQVRLAPPRLVEVVVLKLPEVLWRQSLNIAFLGQQDFREDVALAGETVQKVAGGAVNTRHFGAGLSGPFFSSLYYDAFAYLGTGKQLTYDTGLGEYVKTPILSYLLGAEMRLYLERILNSRFSIRVLWASGDEDFDYFVDGNTQGKSLAFVPLSKSAPALIFRPDLSNSLSAEAGVSVKPFYQSRSSALGNLQVLSRATTFFRPTAGPVSENGYTASTALYLGTEVDVIINFRPFSDFGTALSFGYFVPNGESGSGIDRPVEYLGRLEASFSF